MTSWGTAPGLGFVRIGKIEDTVAPDLDLLEPFEGEILTANEAIRVVVAVSDIGVESDRKVMMEWGS